MRRIRNLFFKQPPKCEVARLIDANDVAAMQHLITRGLDLNQRLLLGMTPLHLAAVAGCAEILALLIKSGGSLSSTDDFGQSPLHMSCTSEKARPSHLRCVKEMLAAGANPNATDNLGGTPLHAAFANGLIEIARALISTGANLRQGDAIGQTALGAALENGHPEMARVLPIPDLSSRIDDPWHASCGTRDAPGSPNAHAWRRKEWMNTFLRVVLHLMRILGPAIVIGHFLCKPLSNFAFLVGGILLWATGHFVLDIHKARLCMAARRGDILEMEELLSAGYKINSKHNNGMTPLHWTANKGHLEATAFLLEQGADPNICDNFGLTPLKQAQKEGHQEIVELIQKEETTES